MAFTIRGVEYYYASVRDDLGAAYRVLAQLADLGVNLLAFTAVPSGPNVAQFALFPDDPSKLIAQARAAGLRSMAPTTPCSCRATTSWALAEVHERLSTRASTSCVLGVSGGRGASAISSRAEINSRGCRCA